MILLSGGFDPIHPGHVSMIRDARKYGPVWVALNSDDWLLRKKGFIFQDWYARRDILKSLVAHVTHVDDSDGTVCDALRRLKPRYFGNGGDRTDGNTPELDLCRELAIVPVFGLGDAKSHTSTAIGHKGTVHRSWGRYTLLDEGEGYKVKKLVVDPGCSTSRQRHFGRQEVWVYPGGNVETVGAGEWHQLSNSSESPLTVIEVQTGVCEEDDIERV